MIRLNRCKQSAFIQLRYRNLWLRRLALVGVTLSVVVATSLSCTSTPEPSEAEIERRPHVVGYELTYEETVEHPSPQPWQTDIYVTWRYSDGSSKRHHAFTGWDFTRDGRFEMVDRLDVTGAVVDAQFDFSLEQDVVAHP